MTRYFLCGKIKEKTMEHFMICRSAFCSACNEAGRPQEGEMFALYQGTKNQIIAQSVGRKTIWGEAITKGYTPHLFSLVKAKDKQVHYMKNCLMNGCGCKMKYDVNRVTGEYDVKFDFQNTKHDIMSVADWNALVSRWHNGTGYEI